MGSLVAGQSAHTMFRSLSLTIILDQPTCQRSPLPSGSRHTQEGLARQNSESLLRLLDEVRAIQVEMCNHYAMVLLTSVCTVTTVALGLRADTPKVPDLRLSMCLLGPSVRCQNVPDYALGHYDGGKLFGCMLATCRSHRVLVLFGRYPYLLVTCCQRKYG